MKSLFVVMASINSIVLTLTLTAFVLWYRHPKQSGVQADSAKARTEFRQHWFLLLWWVLGTVLLYAIQFNILWIVPWMLVGGAIATSSLIDQRKKSQSSSSQQVRRVNSSSNTVTQSRVQQTLLSDFGVYVATKQSTPNTLLVFTSWTLTTLEVIEAGKYCTSTVIFQDGRSYCATFDFDDKILGDLINAASERTQDLIAESLINDAFSKRSIALPDPITIGIGAVLGQMQQGIHDAFIPLVVQEVIS